MAFPAVPTAEPATTPNQRRATAAHPQVTNPLRSPVPHPSILEPVLAAPPQQQRKRGSSHRFSWSARSFSHSSPSCRHTSSTRSVSALAREVSLSARSRVSFWPCLVGGGRLVRGGSEPGHRPRPSARRFRPSGSSTRRAGSRAPNVPGLHSVVGFVPPTVGTGQYSRVPAEHLSICSVPSHTRVGDTTDRIPPATVLCRLPIRAFTLPQRYTTQPAIRSETRRRSVSTHILPFSAVYRGHV